MYNHLFKNTKTTYQLKLGYQQSYTNKNSL